jgi:hypothetical protein
VWISSLTDLILTKILDIKSVGQRAGENISFVGYYLGIRGRVVLDSFM